MSHIKNSRIFFYEFLYFDFCDVTKIFENFNFGVFGCQDRYYEGFDSLSLKLRIIAMLAGSFFHLNGHDVTSRFAHPKTL
jgi:hypothetical protein